MIKSASAKWQGELKTGKGRISTESGALDNAPYGFNTRFEDENGTNPEELIGAAHAGCFSMAFANELGQKDITPDEISTTAEVTLEKQEGGFSVTAVKLTVKAKAPNASEDDIRTAADAAKTGCPISKLLNAEITMELEILSPD